MTPSGQVMEQAPSFLLVGQVDGSNQRAPSGPPLANIVCEMRQGRLEWRQTRYRRMALVGGNYTLGPDDRRHGFAQGLFFNRDVFPFAMRSSGGIHVFTTESTTLSPEIVRDLYEAALALPNEPSG